MNDADIVEMIRQRDRKLDPSRLALKYQSMRADVFAFFRGTCARFYNRLPRLGRLLDAPPAWSCGDLHLENFGTFRASNGLVYFDITDFDEALLAPCSFDLLCATTSLAVAQASLGLGAARTQALMASMADAYAGALRNGHAGWIERDAASGPIGKLLDGLKGKSRAQLLDKRTFAAGKSRKIRIDGSHALEAPANEQARVTRLVGQWAKHNAAERGRSESFYEIADVAVRIAGLGSLGIERYVVLVNGNGEDDGMRLLDFKRARPSAALAAVPTRQPKWPSEADRIFAIQTRMQARSPSDLAVIIDRSRSYLLRELQPREDRLNLLQIGSQPGGLETAVKGFGQLAAWAHLRSAGRQGSAAADALVQFGGNDKWQARMLDLANLCAGRTQDDWQVFLKAERKGAFTQGSSPAR